MQRRTFLASGLAASAALIGKGAMGQSESGGGSPGREHYLLRRYMLRSGPQLALTETYFADALIPALNRMGMPGVGAFKLDIGQETPSYYLLVPGQSPEMLAALELHLAKDATFMKAAGDFWNAPADRPAFERVESSLLAAFAGWPRLTPPKVTAAHGKRIFQLGPYEQPSERAHALKIAMFHDGEFELFRKAGFAPVFFGDTLVGPRMPNLTYMLSFTNTAELEAKWEAFRTDPAWQKMSHSEKYGYEAIVSNISNVMLSPLNCSQI